MKIALLFLLWFPWLAQGHIGSPNVFFEGHAGPHAVRVIIRPPGALPGQAQIDVRVNGDEVRAVTVRPRYYGSGEPVSAPEPVAALAASGESRLFHAVFWLLRRGNYSVEIAVEGASGHGFVAVPLQAAALAPPEMPAGLSITLAILGVLLFIGAVGIAAAFAPHRSRLASGAMALLLAASVALGAKRWQTMDRDFRNHALARPRPVQASIRNAGPLRLLRITPDDAAALPAATWDTLVTDHGKLMHLFLCREPDFAAFAHLHPVRRDGQMFENVLPPLPAGWYQLYAEITYETGLSETLTARLEIPAPSGPELPPMADWKMVNEVWCKSPSVPLENAAQPFALDADDSWQIAPAPAIADTRTQIGTLQDGHKMVFENAGELVENRETPLRFSIFAADGHRAVLQSYMGMTGHAVIRRADGTVFTHLHPAGTISMAAQELLQPRDGATNQSPVMLDTSTGEVSFPYAFPQAGEYRVWAQVRIAGRVLTGDFAVRVKPARQPRL